MADEFVREAEGAVQDTILTDHQGVLQRATPGHTHAPERIQVSQKSIRATRRHLASVSVPADLHGYRLLAQVSLWKKEHDAAIAQAERAVAIAPNDADGYETLAEMLGWGGRAEESLRYIHQAMRLNPLYPFYYLWTLGHGYYLTGRTQDALDAFKKIVERNPNFVPAHAYLAVLFSEMGRPDEARAEWGAASRLSPGASLAILRQRLPYRRAADLDRFLSAARKSGLE